MFLVSLRGFGPTQPFDFEIPRDWVDTECYNTIMGTWTSSSFDCLGLFRYTTFETLG